METATETASKSGRPSFAPGNNANPLGRAARRKREEAERQVEVSALTADLGHEPTAAERLLIDEAAALAVEARKLRRQGRGSADASRLLSRILKQLGLGTERRDRDQPPVESYAALSARIQAEEGARRAQEIAEGCCAYPGKTRP
jgi:hypothetical protein